jgi:hypothetical protein
MERRAVGGILILLLIDELVRSPDVKELVVGPHARELLDPEVPDGDFVAHTVEVKVVVLEPLLNLLPIHDSSVSSGVDGLDESVANCSYIPADLSGLLWVLDVGV